MGDLLPPGSPYERTEKMNIKYPDVKYPDVTVQLIGADGNAFAILGKVQRALREAGADKAEIEDFMAEAMSGDYDHLLATVTAWVEVE